MSMTCSRCGGPDPRPIPCILGAIDNRLCAPCWNALSTWWSVRKDEFPPAMDRAESELMHACRMALDIADAHPAIRDVLRAAIKGAYEGIKR